MPKPKAPPRERFDLTPEQYHIVETWQPGAGALIQKWRESRNWSRQQVATKCLCSESLVQMWERDDKKATGQRKDLLLALLAPTNLVDVQRAAYTTSEGLEVLLARLQHEFTTPVEQWYELLHRNMSKVLICLIQKCTGNIMPGVDTRAIALYFDRYDVVQRAYELSQRKTAVKVSKRGQDWLKVSMDSSAASATTTSSNPESLHNTPTPTSPASTTTSGLTMSSTDIAAPSSCIPGSPPCVLGQPHTCGAEGVA